MSYKQISTISTEEIISACKKSHSFRQTNAVLKCHLLYINDLVERVKQEKIDVSHFNKGDVKCPKCGQPFKVMTILDFDDVGRKLGHCKPCETSEWVEDGGNIIDAYQYFTEGYKTHTMDVIGHTKI